MTIGNIIGSAKNKHSTCEQEFRSEKVCGVDQLILEIQLTDCLQKGTRLL